MTDHTHKARYQRILDRNLRSNSLSQRLDIIWVLIFLSTVVLFIACTFFSVFWLWTNGAFDLPPVRLLEDDRILSNVYDTPNPLFLDAVQHIADNRIYISQPDGKLDSLDMRTRLWRSETTFESDLLSPNFVQLKSGCGNFSIIPEDCSQNDIIWALSEDNGLAQYRNGQWDVLIPNTSFIGSDGQPVDSDSLRAAAVSDDERWLLLGTVEQGIGLYDNVAHRWISTEETHDTLANLEIKHMVYWRGYFWVGTNQGLVRVAVSATGAEADIVDSVRGDVIDLDVDILQQNHDLWVLERRDCLNTDDQCVWLGKFTSPSSEPQSLIDEQNYYGEFNLQDVDFVQQQNNLLVFSGEIGIFTYDDRSHSWDKLLDNPITAVLPNASGNGFYFAYRDGLSSGLGAVNNGNINKWDASLDDPVVKLMFGKNNDVLVITQDQANLKSLHRLNTGSGNASTLYAPESTQYSPESFTQAIHAQDYVLLIGNDGATLHHLENRSYEDFDRDLFPDWIINSQVTLPTSTTVFFIDDLDNRPTSLIYAVSIADLTNPDFIRNDQLHNIMGQAVPKPVRSYWQWSRDSIGIIDGNRDIQVIKSNSIPSTYGASEPDLVNQSPADILQINDQLVLGLDDTIYRYDLESRAWSSDAMALRNQSEIAELAVSGRTLYVRTTDGRLFDSSDTHYIGATTSFDFTDQSMSDVWQDGDAYYLAGSQSIARYSATDRDIDDSWGLDNSDEIVEIKGIINNLPLGYSNDNAYLGERKLNEAYERVTALSSDPQFIWSVREAEGVRYLVRENHAGRDERCYYRNPTAGANTSTILDAREILEQNIAVATNSGVKFYNATYHSWYNTTDAITTNQVYMLGEHLLLVNASKNRSTLQFVALDNIDFPGSCSTNFVTFNDDEQYNVRGVSVDERNARVVWVNDDGTVEEWRSGRTSEILPATTTVPSARFAHVFDRQARGYLLFTDNNNIWRYWLDKRRWEAIERDTTLAVVEVNIEPTSAGDVVTLTTRNGRAYFGTLAPNETVLNVEGIQFVGTGEDVVSLSNADQLIDVQKRGNRWAFLMPNGVRYFNPTTRSWSPNGTINTTDPNATFQRVLDRSVIQTNQGETWWVSDTDGEAPSTFVPYSLDATDLFTGVDDNGNIWRLSEDGQILECEQDARYACETAYLPFYIDSTSVKHAHRWQSFVLFETETGIRIFDRESGEENSIERLSQVNNIEHVQKTQDHLILYADDSTVYVIDQELDVQVYQPQYYIFDNQDKPFLIFETSWLYYTDEGFIEYDIPSNIKPFIVDGQFIAGVGIDNIPLQWRDAGWYSGTMPLPESVIGIDADLLVPGVDGDWWVIKNGRVDHYTPQPCDTDDMCLVHAGGADVTTAVPVYAEEVQSGTIDILYDTGAGFTVSSDNARTVEQPTPTLTPTHTPVVTVAASILVTNTPVATELLTDTPDPTIPTLTSTPTSTPTPTFTPQPTATSLPPLIIYDVQNKNIDLPQRISNDEWSTLQVEIVILSTGDEAFDPVQTLRRTQDGILQSVRYSGIRQEWTDEIATISEFVTPPPLNRNWFKWNRTNQTFDVQTNQGIISLAPNEFVQNGVFIFSPVDAVLVQNENQIYTANQYGIWSFTSSKLSLNENNITYFPIDWTGALKALHGRFIVGDEQVIINQNTVIREPLQPLTINVGGATFTDNLVPATVRGTILSSGTTRNAFVGNGFRWDNNRRHVAYQNNDILLQSDAGIHNARQRFSSFDAGPNDTALNTAQLLSYDGQLYLEEGGVWFDNASGAWQTVTNPYLTRTMVDNTRWTWEKQNDVTQVTLSGAQHDFAYTAQPLGFTSDYLMSAGIQDDKLLIATEAFLQVVGNTSNIDSTSTTVYPPTATDYFETFHFANGDNRLFHYAGGAVSEWDGTQFQSVSPDPAVQRDVLLTNRLRFTLTNGRIEKEISLDDINGNTSWATFNFDRGRFPFDNVTSLTAFDDQLLIGTASGLQTYTAGTSTTSLNNIQQFIDMRSNTNMPALGVNLSGVPLDNPDIVMAMSDDLCIERQLSQSAFTSCADPALLNSRVRVSNPYWQWVRSPNNQIIGNYTYNTGVMDAERITFANGRFPHDQLTQAMICDGQAFSMWDTRWVSAYPNENFSLTQSVTNYDLSQIRPASFLCLDTPQTEGTTQVQDGLYIRTQNNAFYRYNSGTWVNITQADQQALLTAYDDNPLLVEYDNWRLRQNNLANMNMFEYRKQNNTWDFVPWITDGLGFSHDIDHWQEFVIDDNNQPWVATQAGVLPIDYGPGITFNMDNLVIVPTADNCVISDMMQADETIFRCNFTSSQTYSGVLSLTKDEDVFTKYTSDPFATTDWVGTQGDTLWYWRRVNRTGGSSGRLEGEILLDGALNPETITTQGSRFSHDDVSAIALFAPTQIELSSQSSGWYQASRESLGVEDLSRPIAITSAETVYNVDNLRVGYNPESQDENIAAYMLCLSMSDGTVQTITASGAQGESTCPEFLAQSDLWRYERRDDASIYISATVSEGSIGERELIEGRFNDDIVTGLPQVYAYQHENPTSCDAMYWLPTQAGILVFDQDFNRCRLYTPPFTGLSETEIPTVLTVLSNPVNNSTMLAFMNGVSFVSVLDRQPLNEFPVTLPGDVTPISIESDETGVSRLRFKRGAQNGWTLWSEVDKMNNDNQYYLDDVSQYPTYSYYREEWGIPASSLTVSYDYSDVNLWLGDFNGSRLSYPIEHVIDVIKDDDYFYIIAQDGVYVIDLNRAMFESFNRKVMPQ